MSRDAALEAQRRRYRYNVWANDLVLEALVQSTASSDGSQGPGNPLVQATLILTHVFRAEEVWYARIRGEAGPIAKLWQPLSVEHLPPLAEACARGWQTLLANLPVDDLVNTIVYQNSKGERFEQGLNEVLDHVANHGAHHRGQIVLLLRQAGLTPPVTDLIAYQRVTEPTNGQSIRHGSNIELFPGSIEKDDINARLVAKTVSGERIGGCCDRRRLGMPAGDQLVGAAHRPSPLAGGAGSDAPARPGDPAHRERPTRRP